MATILSAIAAAGCIAYAARHGAAIARNIRAPIVGDMGDIPMKMPWYFAEWAEYEGEPTWEVRKGPAPVRTLASKLVSFGFKLRYPDMAELSTPELWNEYRTASIYTTPWIRIGISTGSHFGDGGALDRHLEFTLADASVDYKLDPRPQYGLSVYRPSWIAPSLSKAALLHVDNDILVYRDSHGRVDTLIICSNVKHDAAPCTQESRLDTNIKAWLTLAYRRGRLSDWKIMATKVHHTLMQYRADAGRISTIP
ncbi:MULTISPECIES: hypothetical protein [unclassified Massilia]|uniref:hypothetical protein n=1 Tax=unclassified Massilia TaxID=2609279 RepID=UPI0017863475|nr:MULTISPECIES: hypothetical protein [unclassified Massilia]MBD8531077.1 hypothetical protein [Massilia sp. CFBP 13647]MBD8674777.1 hypothetical protein [Massilia sp. CFBP 13721]